MTKSNDLYDLDEGLARIVDRLDANGINTVQYSCSGLKREHARGLWTYNESTDLAWPYLCVAGLTHEEVYKILGEAYYWDAEVGDEGAYCFRLNDVRYARQNENRERFEDTLVWGTFDKCKVERKERIPDEDMEKMWDRLADAIIEVHR